MVIRDGVIDMFQAVASFCATGTHPALLQGGLLGGLAVAGAAGSVVHCLPMCGPFVMGQVSDRLACLPVARMRESSRIGAGLLLPYHLGRILTYASLGAAVSSLGTMLSRLPWFAPASGLLLLLGALLFLNQGLQRLSPRLARFLPHARFGRAAGGPVARLAARIDRRRPTGSLFMGLVLGFLPCGFLYGALAVAAGSGSTWRGAAAMAAFGLGTVPSLMAVGIAGTAAGRAWPKLLSAVTPVVMVINALALGTLAAGRLAG